MADDVFGSAIAPSVPENSDFDEIRFMITAVNDYAGKIKTAISVVISEIDALASRVASRQTAFAEKVIKFQSGLTVAMAKQQQHKTLLEEAARLNEQLETAERITRQTAERLKERDQAPTIFNNSRQKITNLLTDRHSLLERAASQASEMSEELLKASVRHSEVSEDQVNALCAMVEGSRIRTPDEKVRKHIDTIMKNSGEWDKLCNKLIALCRAKIRSSSVATESPTLDESIINDLDAVFSFETMTNFGRQAIWAKLGPATVTSVLTAVPDAYVEFEFRDNGVYIPFDRASPGQQAAALLTLLLKQKAGTLLIDQPEDDLDNRVIMQIAKLLRTTKINRQLIFATHNPNFVVNGDADKVIVMNSGSNSITTGGSADPRMSMLADGAIETPSVRDAITEIMEGGKEAFELRSRKYDFGR